MIKYFDRIYLLADSYFLGDDENLYYDLESAISNSKKWVKIIHPIPDHIDRFDGTILDFFYIIRKYGNIRTIYLSEDKSRIIGESGNIKIAGKLIRFDYDYSMLFDKDIPNLIDKEFSMEKEKYKIFLIVEDLNYLNSYFKSPDEYLNSRWIEGSNISASYKYCKVDYNYEWYSSSAYLLYRRVKEYEKKQGG